MVNAPGVLCNTTYGHVGANRPATPVDHGRQDSEVPVSGCQEVLIKPLVSLGALASGNGPPKHGIKPGTN